MSGSLKQDVFIIESLPASDVNQNRLDGKILESHLRLTGKNPIYRYVITEEDLKREICAFKDSEYKFLHFSMHGGTDSVGLANGTTLPYDDFSQLFGGALHCKRVTFSVCSLGNENFYNSLFKYNKGLHSAVAPREALQFNDGSAFWVAYYTLVEDEHSTYLTHDFIEERIPQLASLFSLSMSYALHKSSPNDEVEITYLPPKITHNAIKPW